jgi:mannitol 2-dehydrogenase
MTRLDSRALSRLDSRVTVPGYDRDRASVGIVHFGVGAFHRAHQAMYIDSYLAAGDPTWGICGVGVLAADRTIRDVLADQDGLYTLLAVDPDGTTQARIIGSILTHLHAPDDPHAVLDRLTDPATRIVSLTITEGGYSINDATGAFDPQDPATLADLDGADPPGSVLGFIVAALAARRASGTPPFTVMSCDNIQGNGHVAKTAVTAFASRRDPRLASWIARNVAFPSSMVDRITPATSDDTRAAVAAYGIDDQWPVRSESFTQWVLEDRFSAGRPALETVGVQIVDDVRPYELMKLRLLNASHQAMSYLGLLAGATYVHDVCRDPLFVKFLRDYMREEAIPTLQPVPGIHINAYCDQLIARFGSEAIKDTLARQVVDGSDRIPKFLLPVLAEQLRSGRSIARCALVLAAWSYFLGGHTNLDPVDRRLAELGEAVSAEQHTPGAFLAYGPVFGDLGANPTLKSAFIEARDALSRLGARGAIAALSERSGS